MPLDHSDDECDSNGSIGPSAAGRPTSFARERIRRIEKKALKVVRGKVEPETTEPCTTTYDGEMLHQ